MADTFIQAPADGSGKKLDTRTEGTNSEHRQVVVLGDPATNAGVAPVDATNGLSVNVTNASLTVASHAVTNAGTFAVQAAQSGTWTVQPGNTANTTAWLVTGTGGTFPATQSGTWTTRVTDGTNTAVVKPASGAPSASDAALVVTMSPNAWDVGVSTGGTKTQRIAIDTSQLGTLGQTVKASSVPTTLATDQTVTVVATTTANGETASRVNAAASTNATSLKASAGNLFEIDVFNVAAYDVFLKLYNKASAPTVGTDTPVWTIPIKAGTGFSRDFPRGRQFGTGLAYAITKLQADSDTTVVVAGDLTGSIGWI